VRLWPRKQVYVDDLPKTHDLRFAALFLVLFAGLLVALYAVGFFVAGDRLARGASVSGVDIGGMRQDEATTELQEKLLPRLSQPIKAIALGKTFTVTGRQAGIKIDVDATVQSGLGSSRWDPAHMFDVVMGGDPIEPVVEVNGARLDALLSRIAAAVEVAPVDSQVGFPGGEPTVTEGHNGLQLDASAAGDAIRDAVLAGDKEVDLPVDPVAADVGSNEARLYAAGPAARAVSGPVRVQIADVTRTVGVGVFGPALRAEPVDGRLTLTVDKAALARRSAAIFLSLPHHPRNAHIIFRDGRPVVIASTSGVSVAPADWAAAVLKAATKQGSGRVARAKVTPDTPRFTTADARLLKIDQRLSSTTLPVARGVDADTVRAAAARLDGALLQPRDDFSFLARVGDRDPTASTLVASAAYDAAVHAGMQNIFRSQPPTSVIGAEPGLDAAVAPAVDLAWVNQTPFGVFVRAVVSGGSRPELTVSLWGHPYWQVSVTSSGRYNVVQPQTQRVSGTGCQPRRGVAGFAIDVSRTLSRPGEKATTDRTHSQYATVDAIVCAGRR
jgi:vancomycin resistance protein YoaR